MAMIGDVEEVVTFARARGAELPIALANALSAWESLAQLRKRAAPNIAGAVAQAIRDGKLTSETVDEFVDGLATREARALMARDAQAALQPAVVHAVTGALAGPAGDQLTEQLRPAFAQDVAELERLTGILPPGVTAETAIERGPDVITAWQAAPAHLARMRGWGRWAALMVRFGHPTPGGLVMDHPHAPAACYFISVGNSPVAAAIALAPGVTRDDRLGEWGKFWRAGFGVRLNSPSEANAIAAAAEASAQESLTREGGKALETREALENAGCIKSP